MDCRTFVKTGLVVGAVYVLGEYWLFFFEV